MNINEIAKLAGVSRAAVSRYLNNGYVSDEKKERIKEVIEKTGYKPSIQAQRLRTKKTGMIGVVLPKINSESISRMVAGISQVLSEKGYQLLLANTNNNTDEELNYLNLFQENYVDGILFFATIVTQKHRQLLDNLKVPVVVLGQYIKGFSCVYHDDYNAAKEISERVLAHSKIPCYIGVTKNDEAVGAQRLSAFEHTLEELKISDRSLIEEASFSMQSGYDTMKKICEKNNNVDSVICATDSIAIGAMSYLKEIGKSIPKDIQIAGMGDSSVGNVINPRLTTVHFHYKTCGQEAAQILLGHIENRLEINRELKMGYDIVIKDSTRNV